MEQLIALLHIIVPLHDEPIRASSITPILYTGDRSIGASALHGVRAVNINIGTCCIYTVCDHQLINIGRAHERCCATAAVL